MYEQIVNFTTTGVPNVEKGGAAISDLDARSKRLNETMYGSVAATEKLTLANVKAYTEEAKLEQLREKHRIQLDGLSAATAKAAISQEALAAGTQRMVGSTMAASTALRVMEGNMPLRAAASFLSTIQGIGPVLQLAFPVFGAIALFGVVEKIAGTVEKWYDKYVQLKEVQEDIARTAKDLASSTEQSYFNITRMEIASLRKQGKYAQAGGMEAGQASSTPIGLPEFDPSKLEALDRPQVRRITDLYRPMVAGDIGGRIGEGQQTLRNLRIAALNLNNPLAGGQGAYASYGSAAQISAQKDAVDNLLQFLQQRQQEFTKNISAIQEKTQEDIDRPRKEAQEQSRRSLESLRKTGQTPTASFLEKYSALLPADRAAGAAFATGQLQAIAKKEFESYEAAGTKGGVDDGTTVGAFRLYKAALAHSHKLTLTGFDDSVEADEAYKNQKQAVAVYDSAELGRLNTGVGTIRDTANRRARLAGAGGGDELSILRQQTGIRKQAIEDEFKLKEEHSKIYDIDNARLQKVREIGDLDLDYQTKVLELKRQQKEEMVGMAVGLVMAAQHGGASGFVKSQLEGIEGKVLTNLGKAVIDSPAGKSFTDKLHAGEGTFLGKMLQGTPFGPDPMKTAGVTLIQAGRDLSAAARSLAMSKSGGGGSAGGGAASAIAHLAGGGITDADISAAGITPDAMAALNNVPWMGPDAGSGGFSGGVSAAKGSMTLAKGIGIGAAAAAGGFAAYSGFKSGGAQGALSGSGALVGASGAIIGLAGVTGPAAPILAGVGLALGVMSSLLGDPKQRRAQQIQDEMKYNQYLAPVAINASMSTGGSYTDFDRFGAPRNSSLSPFPSIQQGFFDYRNNVTVPGRTTSSFGGGPNVTVNVQTLDSRSFNENSDLVADAVHHALTTGRALPLQETLRRM